MSKQQSGANPISDQDGGFSTYYNCTGFLGIGSVADLL